MVFREHREHREHFQNGRKFRGNYYFPTILLQIQFQEWKRLTIN